MYGGRLLEDVHWSQAHSRRDPPDRAWKLPRHSVLGQDPDNSLCAAVSRVMTTESNPDRPLPKANTGSALLSWLSDASIALMHLERRFDPFFRPAFDAVLRDPAARVATAIINSTRPNEGLKI